MVKAHLKMTSPNIPWRNVTILAIHLSPKQALSSDDQLLLVVAQCYEILLLRSQAGAGTRAVRYERYTERPWRCCVFSLH
jgi:hypothetical protein